jgi:hypothetical protein
MNTIIDLSTLTHAEVLGLYSSLLDELRTRGLTRTNNNPVADLAEKTVVEFLHLERAPKEARGYDATGKDGSKYQIKGRRITKHNSSRQLGVVRNLDEGLFDYMIAAIFDEAFNVSEIWRIPHSTIKKYANWSKQTNGHVLRLSGEVLLDKSIQRVKYP